MALVNSILEGLFPNHCAICDLRSQRTIPLCRSCEADLRPNDRRCDRCALPVLRFGSGGATLCGNCLQRAPAFDRVVAPWLYSDHLAHIIRRWKYHGDTYLTPLLAHLWLTAAGAPEADLLVPVPLHWRKLWHRGYNQASLLADRLYRQRREIAMLGVDDRLARRRRATRAQSGLEDAASRRQNLRGAFTTRRGCASLRVAIVDDVLTTGATADTLARALRHAGASRVEVWCLARTPPPGN